MTIRVYVDRDALLDRLRLTGESTGRALLGVPSLVLLILTVVGWPLTPVFAGVLILSVVVPATRALTGLARRLSGERLGEPIPEWYAADAHVPRLGRVLVWVRDPARWRDVGWLAFSATGGFVLSLVPAFMLVAPLSWLVILVAEPSWLWVAMAVLAVNCLAAWWTLTPSVMRLRARADRAVLRPSRAALLARRVDEVTTSRAQTLDHSAAELRRIERDLHDGAQARLAAVGMNVGLAEKLVATDPAAAAELLREARSTTQSALEDLRAVVRGIHPPVLADRGLAGAVTALAVALPLPVEVSVSLSSTPPAPVESAAYFAVAECLANIVKHASASRAWVSLASDSAGGDSAGGDSAGSDSAGSDSALRIEVRDDGAGGADESGSGLAGVTRRLAAFDGTLAVSSPLGGGTVVTMSIP